MAGTSTVQPAGSAGYTFPLMLVIVSALAFGASRLEVAESYRLKRDKEEELLFRGREYARAIAAFSRKNKRYPRELAELMDDRSPQKRQFIRQLYKDPMSGGNFTPILNLEGSVIGVASASNDVPFRKVPFEGAPKDFDKAKTYADWRFEAR